MKEKTVEKILEYISEVGQVSPNQISDTFAISRQALYKHLNALLEQHKITKVGKPPKVYYSIKSILSVPAKVVVDSDVEKIISERYLIITPAGEVKEGMEGFTYWCEKLKLPVAKTVLEYQETLKRYDTHKRNGLIDGIKKMKRTFDEVGLDELFYLDFYSIERFGKTKLGQWLLYAKQSQNKGLIKNLINTFKAQIDILVKTHKIDAVGFIPPSVKREVQFMKELEKNLKLKIKPITIIKIKTKVVVPQKTLSKLEDRMENARNTFVIEDIVNYKNILLIDDAVGSGATLNEVARKIKYHPNFKGKIIGLAITGSFKGFDVISEV